MVQGRPGIVQLKPGVPATTVKRPVAPPVYRPQPTPHCVQAKMPHPAHAHRPGAPPVYRPQPQPKVLQTKTAIGRPANAGPGKFTPPHLQRPFVAQTRAGSVVQQSKRGRGGSSKKKKESDDEEDAYVPPWEMPREKQLRFSFLVGTEESVIKKTAHKVSKFNKSKYKSVYTCRGCKRMIAYVDKKGGFNLTQYGYLSKSNKEHELRAVALDHHPDPWAKRLKQFEKDGTPYDDQRRDYQDEGRLRALCKVCNESHAYEGVDVVDYDSDEDDFEEPKTPPHESQYNSGQFSGYRPVVVGSK